ncbi:DMT family transporter [Mucilaginibacter agri]|uniref:Guanidinium exporter n=1 Tax=Mucilaginibacter agri TaxID=2695265 RepID=A0A965ZK66_9SPHI|nr:multidrug efflux SMR transporter [Mucilaginibacter agri]NCD71207.1 QacE family quaternary ammonium compound efflux SMR transporter [Mucilaginibacter agri]
MTWVALIIAGILEVVWSYFMKQSQGFTKLTPSIITIISMLCSFALLAYAMRSLPLSIAYPVWTGIGAVGAFIIGITLLGEHISAVKIAAGILIIAGVIMMKFSSSH